MVRPWHLLTALVVAVSLVSPLPAAATGRGCTQIEANSGLCADASTDGQSVSVRAEQRSVGRSAGPVRRADPGRVATGGSGARSDAPKKEPVLIFARGKVTDISGLFPNLLGPPAASCVGCDPADFVVSVSDLVNFTPPTPEATMEPNGWAVVGVPANFIAQSGPEMQSGPLLGFEAEVRFTPLRYAWNYGDGIRRSTEVGGQTWQALGLPEFSQTLTSHSFETPGRFTAEVEATFLAEYRFSGGRWQEVSGVVTSVSPPLSVLVGQAKTVLVSQDCSADRAGPGC